MFPRWLGRLPPNMSQRPTVLAIASAGGHLVQLCRLMPAWEGCKTVIATTNEGYRGEVEALAEQCGLHPPTIEVVTEANRWQKLRMLRSIVDVGILMLRIRPHVVVTTGAAPGLIALFFARLVGARTVWVDSIANSDELSLSGKMAGRRADLWLTQWEHLSRSDGPYFRGSVL